MDIADALSGRRLWHRYEIKYLISESQAAAIAQFVRPFMRLDRYCQLQPKRAYPIVSLYLDSDDLQLCRESMTGKKNRFKLRIRSYTDRLDYPRFFEIKRRASTVIIKGRAHVMPENVASLVSGRPRLSQVDGDETLKQFMFYMNHINGRPILRTRYMREAFESIVDDSVRVTFDRNLSYNVTSTATVAHDGEGWQPLLSNGVILEIKFTGRYPPWLGRMVKYFNLQQQSISKYAISVKKSALLGFCTLTLPE
jgi:hypothetical protein